MFGFEKKNISKSLLTPGLPIRSLAFSDDSKYLVTVSDDSYVKVYDVLELEKLQENNKKDVKIINVNLSGHSSWVLNVTFAPDSNHFATGYVN